MTINDFNSKINLPALIKDGIIDGPKDGIFVKVPRFGWFVKDPNNPDDVRNLTMLVKFNEAKDLYKDLILNKTQYHEPKITYSESGLNRLVQGTFRYQSFATFYFLCVQEADQGAIFHNGKSVKLRELLMSGGNGHLLENGIGLCSLKLLREWNENNSIKVPNAVSNKLIYPTYCAPDFPISLEYATLDTPADRKEIFSLGEKGWYGRLKNRVLSDPVQLMYETGFTWDPKVNYWLNETVDIDPTFTTRRILEIWKEAKSGIFIEGSDPLTLIEKRGDVGELKHYLKSLKFHQVEALQKRFGEDFIKLWHNCEEDTVRVENMTFTMTPSGIDMYRRGERDEFTNFSIVIEKYVRRGKKVYRAGTIGYQGKFVSFELENETFLTPRRLVKAVETIFFDNALGIPIVSSRFSYLLLDVINRFSRHAIFEQID